MRIHILMGFLILGFAVAQAQKRAMTFDDVMKFKQLRNPVLSDGGNWVGYESWPDRGDGEAIVQHAKQNQKRFVIPLGQKPLFSVDEKWAGVTGKPSLEAEETAKKKKTKTFGDVTLINLQTGAISTYKGAKAFDFSADGKLAFVHFNLSDSLDKVYKKTTKRTVGTKLIVKELATGKELEIPFVYAAAFDSLSARIAYSVADTSGKNSLRMRAAGTLDKDSVLHEKKDGLYEKLKWHFKSQKLAFLVGVQDKEGKTSKGDLHIWPAVNGETIVRSAERFKSGWTIPSKGELNWSMDGKFLTFGIRLDPAKPVSYEDSAFKAKDYYNQERILAGIEGDLWHGEEPRIKTHEKKVKDRWKTQFFTAVYSLDQKNYTVLSDTAVPGLRFLKNAPRALQITEVPNLKSSLWEGSRVDLFVVDYDKGFRTPVAQNLRSGGEISPDGKFVAFWKAPHWYLFTVDTKAVVNLTEGLPVRFDDEENDLPNEAGPWGFGGWTHGVTSVLLYDKFDIWQFSLNGGAPKNVTVNGRTNELSYRLVKTYPDLETFASDKPLLLQAQHDKKKYQAFYAVTISKKDGAVKLLEDQKKFTFVAKSKKADQWMYSRQSYNDFPDLWIADASFKKPVRITAMNPVVQELAWGTPELVEWKSPDGTALQGVLIKPDNFQPGKPVPVLVYFYEIMSGRMFDFPTINVDTRPDFPQFVTDGYAVFLPDIIYAMDGKPMESALRALTSGVTKIIEMGVADPARVGLHGHSWGGTQTTYVIAKSNMFKAALAGAPVTNWVSAYSGIRWESGLARQFQYERTQSRIGKSLWESPELYLENSAVWYANTIQTPLLLQHGDADGSVPWYQSIELFLALKRQEKPVWFLQYFGEDHHLAKYPNKLDYAIKFKEFFDFYLKDAPEPEWMKSGIPYMPKFE